MRCRYSGCTERRPLGRCGSGHLSNVTDEISAAQPLVYNDAADGEHFNTVVPRRTVGTFCSDFLPSGTFIILISSASSSNNDKLSVMRIAEKGRPYVSEIHLSYELLITVIRLR